MLEAAQRADQLQEEGDWQGAVDWHRILDCIERIQAQKPAVGGGAASPRREACYSVSLLAKSPI